MRASPSSAVATKPPTLQELTAEAHRLYAILVPTGKVQVVIPEHERAQYQARYMEVYAQLQAAQGAQASQRAQADKWAAEAAEAIPEMIPLLPPEWRDRMQGLAEMGPGPERDKALRAALNSIVNGGALQRLGPMGVALGPMLRKFLRNKP